MITCAKTDLFGSADMPNTGPFVVRDAITGKEAPIPLPPRPWTKREEVALKIQRAIDENGFEDLYKPIVDKLKGRTIQPYWDQSKLAEDCLKSMSRVSYQEEIDLSLGVVMFMMTGGGKTETAILIIRWLRKHCKKLSIGFCSPRDELVEQSTIRIRGAGFNVWRYQNNFDTPGSQRIKGKGRGKKREPSIWFFDGDFENKSDEELAEHISIGKADVLSISTCTMADRFSDKGDRSAFCDVMIFDECHIKQYQRPFAAIAEASGILGLTATPYNHNLRAFWRPKLVTGATQYELELKGRTSTPVFHSFKWTEEEKIIIQAEKINRGKAEWQIERDEKAKSAGDDLHKFVLSRLVGEILAYEEKLSEETGAARSELRWIVRAPNQRYAKNIARTLNDGGIGAKAFSSDEARGQFARDAQLKEFNEIFSHQSALRVGVIVSKFTTGWDSPGVEGVILTNNTEFETFSQLIGRGLRAGFPPLKKVCHVLDFAENFEDYMDKYSMIRIDPPKEIDPTPDPKADRLEDEDDDENDTCQTIKPPLTKGNLVRYVMPTPEDLERHRARKAKEKEIKREVEAKRKAMIRKAKEDEKILAEKAAREQAERDEYAIKSLKAGVEGLEEEEEPEDETLMNGELRLVVDNDADKENGEPNQDAWRAEDNVMVRSMIVGGERSENGMASISKGDALGICICHAWRRLTDYLGSTPFDIDNRVHAQAYLYMISQSLDSIRVFDQDTITPPDIAGAFDKLKKHSQGFSVLINWDPNTNPDLDGHVAASVLVGVKEYLNDMISENWTAQVFRFLSNASKER